MTTIVYDASIVYSDYAYIRAAGSLRKRRTPSGIWLACCAVLLWCAARPRGRPLVAVFVFVSAFCHCHSRLVRLDPFPTPSFTPSPSVALPLLFRRPVVYAPVSAHVPSHPIPSHPPAARPITHYLPPI
ncbi:hypothetical protein HYPSUDRAFT_208954 [Hypholoma sublateritium FD-334 SS-4]|uniref:Uncharacterized protein n=1 Tax=Hypholoma sublateritium (strain FD-334 SS-4) TaxID=945553 RepID=A0A0D2P0G2_HYPSF|nr:hypothetical protein HYPSUDRAFT_208954 [Hypholoma sublateritium FD-334 SS-4]